MLCVWSQKKKNKTIYKCATKRISRMKVEKWIYVEKQK